MMSFTYLVLGFLLSSYSLRQEDDMEILAMDDHLTVEIGVQNFKKVSATAKAAKPKRAHLTEPVLPSGARPPSDNRSAARQARDREAYKTLLDGMTWCRDYGCDLCIFVGTRCKPLKEMVFMVLPDVHNHMWKVVREVYSCYPFGEADNYEDYWANGQRYNPIQIVMAEPRARQNVNHPSSASLFAWSCHESHFVHHVLGAVEGFIFHALTAGFFVALAMSGQLYLTLAQEIVRDLNPSSASLASLLDAITFVQQRYKAIDHVLSWYVHVNNQMNDFNTMMHSPDTLSGEVLGHYEAFTSMQEEFKQIVELGAPGLTNFRNSVMKMAHSGLDARRAHGAHAEHTREHRQGHHDKLGPELQAWLAKMMSPRYSLGTLGVPQNVIDTIMRGERTGSSVKQTAIDGTVYQGVEWDKYCIRSVVGRLRFLAQNEGTRVHVFTNMGERYRLANVTDSAEPTPIAILKDGKVNTIIEKTVIQKIDRVATEAGIEGAKRSGPTGIEGDVSQAVQTVAQKEKEMEEVPAERGPEESVDVTERVAARPAAAS